MDIATFTRTLIQAEAWAVSQKRVTNKMIRDRFDATEEEADDIYKSLKAQGIVGSMGYVR